MDMVTAAGARLATSTQTVWKEDKLPPDKAAIARAEAEVNKWRQAGDLSPL